MRPLGAMTLLAVLLATVVLCTAPLAAQTVTLKNPNDIPSSFYYPLKTAATYTTASDDTTGTFAVCGATLSSFTITVTDSAAFDIYVDRSLDGGTTWANILTDSLITTSNSGTKQQYALRTSTVEKYGGLGGVVRFGRVARGSGQGTTSGRTFSETLNWKP